MPPVWPSDEERRKNVREQRGVPKGTPIRKQVKK
jgi:hypothetical protein